MNVSRIASPRLLLVLLPLMVVTACGSDQESEGAVSRPGIAATKVNGDSETALRAVARTIQLVEGSLRLTLIAEPEVAAGEHTFLRLLIEPVNDFALQFDLGLSPFDFYVRRMDDEVWRWFGGNRVKPAALELGVSMSQSRPLLYQVEWYVTDFDGVPLEPGDYVVGGQFEIQFPQEQVVIETARLEVTVLPASQ